MKKIQIKSKVKELVSPSIKFELKQRKGRVSQFLAGLFFWSWESFKFPLCESNSIVIHYLGRSKHKLSLMALLGVSPNSNNILDKSSIKTKVFVSEFPMRDSVCIPFYLTTIVKLNRSIDDIMANYASSLRRSINKQRSEYRYVSVDSAELIDDVELKMLRPYASARHDLAASHVDSQLVKNLVQTKSSRLDLLYQGETPVGCHLGNAYMRKGKRYWHVNRFGYPCEVFSDYKRWSEVNSINLHLALEVAHSNGYDYCDYGMSLAKPGAGLIEWKRRRKGFLSLHDNHNYFYLKFPKSGAADFFWQSPVFAVEKHKITLHLGIPENTTHEDVLSRYREMSYGGLYKVYLHSTNTLNKELIETIRSLYSDQESQPEIISYLVK